MNIIKAEPFPLEFDLTTTALVIIDMQRDFVLPGGFGEKLGNDTSLLLAAVEPTQRVLEKAREKKMLVIHTREGHRPDLTDCPAGEIDARGTRPSSAPTGPMGRILVRGETGHDIIHQLYPIAGRADHRQARQGIVPRHRPASDPAGSRRSRRWLSAALRLRFACTPPCARRTTVAMNAWYSAIAWRSYFPEFQRVGLEMIKAQGGIFGWVSNADNLIAALA